MITGWEQIAKDMARVHGNDFVRDFCKTITDEVRAEEEVVYAHQRKIAKNQAQIDQCYVDGVGQCVMRVDATVFWHWVRRYGRDIWNDRNFIRIFQRDNPDVRVKSRSRKTIVVRP